MRLETSARAGLPLQIEFFVDLSGAEVLEDDAGWRGRAGQQRVARGPDGAADFDCEVMCHEQVSARPSLLYHSATVASGCGIRGAIMSKGRSER